MNMQAFKLQNLFLATAMIAMASCSDSVIEGIDPEANPLDDYVTDVKLNVEDFEYVGEDGTRTSYDFNWETNKGYNFAWANGDQIGVLPTMNGDKEYYSNTMVKYVIENTADANGHNAVFDGRGWQLKKGVEYSAIYPYDYQFNDPEFQNTTEYKAFNITFRNQRQKGNNSTAHIGKYDFMASTPVTSTDGSLNFSFKHLAMFCEFELNLPADKSFEAMYLKLKNADAKSVSFMVDGAIYGLGTENPYIGQYYGDKVNTLTVRLEDFKTNSDNAHIFVMLPPEMFKTYSNYLIVEVQDTDKNIYQYPFLLSKVNYAGKHLKLTSSVAVPTPVPNEAQMINGKEFNQVIKDNVNTSIIKAVSFETRTDLDGSYNIDLTSENSFYEVRAKYDLLTRALKIATMANAITVDNCESMFQDLDALEEFDGFNNLDTSNAISMKNMFKGCETLIAAPAVNTSLSRSLSGMFEDCYSLTSIDFSKFNTTYVSDMSVMFKNCKALTDLDISTFYHSGIKNYASAFMGCSSLRTVKFGEITVGTYFSGMFYNCENLEEINGTIKSKEVRNVASMFKNCKKLKTVNLRNCKMSSCEDMSAMFSGCESLESINLNSYDTNSLDSECVKDMSEMFYNCKNLKNIIMSANTKNVTNMSYMFYNCGVRSLDLSSMETPNLINCSYMFEGCENLSTLNLSKATFESVVTFKCMFEETLSLGDLDLRSMKVNKDNSEINYINMFSCCGNGSGKITIPKTMEYLLIDESFRYQSCFSTNLFKNIIYIY